MLIFLVGVAAAADPMELAFREAHRNFAAHATDQFSDAAIDETLRGTSFRILLPVRALGTGEGGPYFTYNNGKLAFVFEPLPQSFALSTKPSPALFSVGGTRTIERTYTGTNAFGTKMKVTVQRVRENAVEMRDRPAGVPDPAFTAIPELASEAPEAYSVEFQMSGPYARALANDAELVIEGTITPLVGGELNYCKPLDQEPTVISPVEIHGEQCWIGANVSRVAFTRKTGEVLKEWLK